MKKIAIIPARYASSRFPGKPLALLGNKPMIMWVYDAVSSSGLFDKVVVATDDDGSVVGKILLAFDYQSAQRHVDDRIDHKATRAFCGST